MSTEFRIQLQANGIKFHSCGFSSATAAKAKAFDFFCTSERGQIKLDQLEVVKFEEKKTKQPKSFSTDLDESIENAICFVQERFLTVQTPEIKAKYHDLGNLLRKIQLQ